MRKPTISVWTFIVAVALALCASPAQAVTVGKKFPPFTGKDAMTGQSIALEDLQGKVVLVDFWATWCGPCVGEIPNVKNVHSQYADKGFVVISISLDSDKAKCKAFIKDRRMDWSHIVDGGGWGTRLAKKYGINSIPKMFLIDHNGICISDSARGDQLGPAVERALKKIPASTTPVKKENDEKPTAPKSREDAKKSEPLVPTIDPAQLTAMQGQVDQAAERLDQSTFMLSKIVSRIEHARSELIRVESDLPSPKRANSTRDAYLRVRGEILGLRRDLFELGLLNERAIIAPSDPFTGKSQNDLQPFFQAKSQIAVAVTALDEMKQAVGPEADAADLCRVQLAGAANEVKKGQGNAQQLQQRCDEACAEARDISERWTTAWQDQLQQLHEVVAQLTAPTAQLSARCDEINGQIAFAREALAKNDLAKGREQFGSILQSLANLTKQMQSLGVAKQVKQPGNPFEKRRTDDRMLAAEAEVQLKSAAAAVAQLREAVQSLAAVGQKQAEAFLPRIKEMQGELSAGASGKTSDLRGKYQSLCDEILLAHDKSSSS